MQSKQSRKFFKRFGENEMVRELLGEAVERARNHSHLKEKKAHRDNFERWQELQSRKFAAKKAHEIFAL
jgi:hypothetical protein